MSITVKIYKAGYLKNIKCGVEVPGQKKKLQLAVTRHYDSRLIRQKENTK